MQLKPISLGNIEEGLDRQQLVQLQKRFLQINRERLARAAQSLSSRDNLLLDLLPLLFHVNHPSLPGFIRYETPCGVSGYQPDAGALRQIKTLSRAFHYQRSPAARDDAIDALFLMGSPGTLGQSAHSDLDVWVCHRPELDPKAIALLNRKAQDISQWAAGEGIELHFFLMDATAFRRGIRLDLDNESSGSTQHRLLLDEFYRTALHLAGKLPLWWFIEAERETDYDKLSGILLQRRYLRAADIIDFGPSQPVPLEEFVSAATWQLYKAIDAPYKAFLKLLLLEVYSEQQQQLTLAQQFKCAVYAGNLNVDQLDPYLMLYQRLERYLQQKGQEQRLELIRRCFYFKVNQALSKRTSNSANWQRSKLQQLVSQWGWSSHSLVLLDKHRQWKCPQVIQEKNLLTRELTDSYRYIHDLAPAGGDSNSRQDIAVLGRKLYAAYEKTLGKIEWINPSISDDIAESQLSISATTGIAPRLQLLRGTGQLRDPLLRDSRQALTPLYRGNSISELLLWAYRNGVYVNGSHLHLPDDSSSHNLANLDSALQTWLPLPMQAVPHAHFLQAAAPASLLILINMEHRSEADVIIEAAQTDGDPLRYGRQRDCLIHDLAIGLHNSWNEVFCYPHLHQPVQALALECCRQQLRLPRTETLPVVIFCRPSHYRNIILRRLQALVKSLIRFCQQLPQEREALFIFPLGAGFCCLKVRGNLPGLQYCNDTQQLYQHLGSPHQQPATLQLDPLLMHDLPLASMCPHLRTESIQAFLYREADRAYLYVFDERNSLHYSEHLPVNSDYLLKPLHRFLRNIFNRHTLTSDPIIGFDLYTVEFYEMRQEGVDIICQQRAVANDLRGLSTLNIQVFAELSGDQVIYSVQCNDIHFSVGTHDCDRDFAAIARHILLLRRGRERYPCTITDLDISRIESTLNSQTGIQTSHYLQIKQQFENRLNQAITTVSLD